MSTCFLLIIFFLLCFILLLLKKLFWLSELPDLHNKHVLITGGSSGIGKSAAIEAAKLGAHVTIIARNKIKLKAAVEEIKNSAKNLQNQKVHEVALNVTESYNVMEETVASIEADVGPIFLLINCAGSAVCGEINDATEVDFKYMMDLNYFGTVFLTLAVARKMKKRNEGHIVITGSQASLLGIYGMSAYCSSKFALRGFAESLHMELQPFNVSVTLALPPDTNTPGFENEEKSKPEITKLISETAGLFEPIVVARQLLSDALNKKFFSTVGFESLILTTLCAGMSPIGSWPDVFLQVLSMSFLRLISIGYILHFQKLIFKHLKTLVAKKSSFRKDK